MKQLITDYYITHRDELLAFVSSRLGSSMEAEDIVQDVFLRLLTSDKLITAATLPALVYTMTRNRIADYYRRHTTFEQYEHYIKGICNDETTMESVFSAKEIMERLERGLVRLKVGEISSQLGEGYKSVEHRLGFARKTMRQYLRQYA